MNTESPTTLSVVTKAIEATAPDLPAETKAAIARSVATRVEAMPALIEDALRTLPHFEGDAAITPEGIRAAGADLQRMVKLLREIRSHGNHWGGVACGAHAFLALGRFADEGSRHVDEPKLAMVPIEPTAEMLKAGCEAGLATATLLDDTRFACERAVWAAMVKTGVGAQ